MLNPLETVIQRWLESDKNREGLAKYCRKARGTRFHCNNNYPELVLGALARDDDAMILRNYYMARLVWKHMGIPKGTAEWRHQAVWDAYSDTMSRRPPRATKGSRKGTAEARV